MTAVHSPGAADQQEVVEFLASPATHGGAAVERHETHGALVFLAGDRAYKLKRAIRYPYMDFSTRERRHDACVAELAINRRTAPEIYLEVRSLLRAADGGLRFGPSDAADQDTLDWVVVMRRFDQAALFEQLRRTNSLSVEDMRALADVVAGFHKAAEPAPRYGGAEGIREVLDTALKVIESMAAEVFDRHKVDRLARLTWASLDRVGPQLARRRDAGFVRRCHGDLHLNNICRFDGRPVLFDAIEFNDSFACIDVIYDLAFLLMDLDRHGLRGFANAVLNRYLEHTRDYEGLTALPLFVACRAAIRAHIAVSTARAMPDAVTGQRKLEEARAQLDQAIAYLEPPPARLVAIGGLSGTGKTTVARGLAPAWGAAPGAVILRSDVTRKRLMGAEETARLAPSGYTQEITEKVFATLAEGAARVLAAGHSAIMDAVYGDPMQRAVIREVAARAGVRFDGFWLEAPREVMERRVEGRRGDASDAGVEVVRDQLGRIEAPAEWRKVMAVRPTAEVVDEISRRLDETTARQG